MNSNYFRKDVYYDLSHHKHKNPNRWNLALLIPLIVGFNYVNVTETQASSPRNMLMEAATVHVQHVLKGKITDENGKPIKGATIRILNSSIQVESNADGSFQINATNIKETDQLLITSVGYQNRTISIRNNRDFQVSLVSEQTDLEEVVIVGYGSQKKENLTGSVDVLSGKALADRPANNIADLIKGASPNMNINIGMRGGEPGASSSWNIRGVG